MAAISRRLGNVTVEKVRENVLKARQIPEDQLQWTDLFNCDEYAVVYAEKP
jgi:hypothetical protein